MFVYAEAETITTFGNNTGMSYTFAPEEIATDPQASADLGDGVTAFDFFFFYRSWQQDSINGTRRVALMQIYANNMQPFMIVEQVLMFGFAGL